MSYTKMGKVFPILSPHKTAQILGETLREIYGGAPPTIKAIAALTSADLKTIKNWYAGRNVPHLSHFLELCSNDPTFLFAVLRRIGYADIADQGALLRPPKNDDGAAASFAVYSIIFDTINADTDLDLIRKLNIRQVWFYGELKKGHTPGLSNLMHVWAVGKATAKRDLSGMSRLGLIRYAGSRRNGHYII